MRIRFLFPIAVLFWTLVIVLASGSSECQHEVLAGHKLDPESSRKKNATVNTVNAVTASSPEECGQSCCNELSGMCNVAQYTTRIKIDNCIMYTCLPSSACTFQRGAAIQIIQIKKQTLAFNTPDGTKNMPIKSSNESSDLRFLHADVSTSSAEMKDSSDKISEFSSTSPKTANDFLAATKSSVFTSEQMKLHQNTSHPTHPKYILIRNSSAISELHSLFDEPLSDQSEPHSAQNGSMVDQRTHADSNSEKSFTEKKTQPKASNDDVAHILGRNMNTIHEADEAKTNTTNNTASENDDPTPPPMVPLVPSPTQPLNSTSAVNVQTTIPSAEMTSVSPGHNISEIETTSSSATSTQVPSSTDLPSTEPSSIPTVPEKPIRNDSTKGSSPPPTTPSTVPVHENGTLPDTMRTSALNNTTPSPLSNSSDVSEPENQAEDDFRVKARFHLVIALVLGLMLLLTVVGLVLRRVYDVWLRRHYHRMDFLVDGLYNSINT